MPRRAALEKAVCIFLDENGEGAAEVIFKIRKASTEDAEAIVEVFDHVPFLKDCYRGEAGISLVRRFNSEVQQRCIDDMAEHRGWGKGRGQGRKSPAAMRT